MMHKNRRHLVTECGTIENLAKRVRKTTWTECSAFRAGSLTLLNDSTNGDGAQEYAVLRGGRQIESLTVSWMTTEHLTEVLRKLDEEGSSVDMGPYAVKPHGADSCIHCA